MTAGLVVWILSIMQTSRAEAHGQVRTPPGTYTPFARDEGEKDRQIPSLLVDRYPVTNEEFAAFLRMHPEWRKSRIAPLFAQSGYLEDWTGDTRFPQNGARRPVTNVSWFAARKYCAERGQRLLTLAEWEYVSRAGDPQNLNIILAWYGKPDALTTVEAASVNAFGLSGMHGLIWEWVEDFGSAIVATDARDTGIAGGMFCGGGALGAKDPAQYATFMRFAHRSSLKANSVGRTLGFRCAGIPKGVER